MRGQGADVQQRSLASINNVASINNAVSHTSRNQSNNVVSFNPSGGISYNIHNNISVQNMGVPTYTEVPLNTAHF